MFFLKFILALVLCSSLSSPLIATTERGDRLITEAGALRALQESQVLLELRD
jgi:hypothetical protein